MSCWSHATPGRGTAALVVVGALLTWGFADSTEQKAGGPFTATAYSVEGETAAGTQTHEGIVAADPDVLPLGSRIRIEDAGEYSGVYVVRDTGPKVKGRQVDIYLANDAEAKRFGKRQVRVEVLQRGEGRAP